MKSPKLPARLISAFFLLIAHFSFGQAPMVEWQNTIGGSSSDYCSSISQTNDGGYILGGYSYSGISGDKTEVTGGPPDYWVLKLDSIGGIEWQNTIGGSGIDRLASIIQTVDGGYLLGGSSYSGISGDKTESGNGFEDYWIVKLNSAGSIEWQNTIGGSGYDNLGSIAQTDDGGYILGGHSSSNISGDKTENSNGTYDYWVVKLNSAGGIEWQNSIGGSGFDDLQKITQTVDGGFILGGYSDSGISGDKTEACLGVYDYWVVKLNSAGGIEWQNTIGGSSYDYLESAAQTNDGGYILGGRSSSNISGDKTENSNGFFDYWVVKLNFTGGVEWQNTIGGNVDDHLYSMQQTMEGGYILGGYSASGISGDKTEAPIGGADYWVVKLNSMGGIQWQNTIGGSSGDVFKSIAQTDDSGYIIGGNSLSNISGDKTENCFGFEDDYWVLKLYGTGCGPELCNALDDDCDGLIDEGGTPTISIAASGATTFCSGGSVVLTATHSGTSLQWRKNGVNITGATGSTYTVTKAGDYTCVSTLACATAISNVIAVVVNKNPGAIISAGGATTFCAGGSVTLTVTITVGCSYQWYKNGAPIAGATSTTYTATTAGSYRCRVTKTATGCFKNSNFISVTVPCREMDNSPESGFLVYPNPASDFITIETDLATEKTIYITDALGLVLQTITTSENTIIFDLNSISSGVYFIKMEDGVNAVTQKFIKQ